MIIAGFIAVFLLVLTGCACFLAHQWADYTTEQKQAKK
jgi:hypothetical protein